METCRHLKPGGLLFPDTYQVSNADNEGQVIERMIELMERVAFQEELEPVERSRGQPVRSAHPGVDD